MSENKVNNSDPIKAILLGLMLGCLILQFIYNKNRSDAQDKEILKQVHKNGWVKGNLSATRNCLHGNTGDIDMDYARDSVEIFDVILKKRYN